MSDFGYYLISRILSLVYWRGTLLGGENLPARGPAVIVANHLGPAGPIGAACSIPLRMYPWIIADMVDRERAANYLRLDFVEPSLKLKPPFSKLAARAITSLSVPLLSSLGCIPVTLGDTQELVDSVALLKKGKVVQVFPEDPDMDLDPVTQIRPFYKGFTRMGELYYAESGEILHFYPVAVHGSRQVRVGEPVIFDPANTKSVERLRLKQVLRSRIQEMYLELERSQL